MEGKTRVGTVTEEIVGKALNPSLSDNLLCSGKPGLVQPMDLQRIG